MQGPYYYTSGRTTRTRKEQQQYLRSTWTYWRRRSKQGLGRSSYQEFYQCLVTWYKITEIQSGWQSTGLWSGFERKRKCDTLICGTALWGTSEMACIWMESGLPSGKCAAVFAEGLSSGAVASGLGKVRYLNKLGRGVCQRRLTKYWRIADAKEYRETHPKQKLNASAWTLGV